MRTTRDRDKAPASEVSEPIEKPKRHRHVSSAYLPDKVDRRIIALLEESPFINQMAIAKKLGVSQATVAARLAALRKSSLLVEVHGINYELLGMMMSRVDVDCDEEKNVLGWAEKCPLFINASKGIGENNLSLFFATEDMEMFEYLVNQHLRSLKGVNSVDFNIIQSWVRPFTLMLNLDYDNMPKPPCATMPYCPRCPSNPKYNGRVWNHQRLVDIVENST